MDIRRPDSTLLENACRSSFNVHTSVFGLRTGYIVLHCCCLRVRALQGSEISHLITPKADPEMTKPLQ